VLAALRLAELETGRADEPIVTDLIGAGRDRRHVEMAPTYAAPVVCDGVPHAHQTSTSYFQPLWRQ
jgi:hypothetical protein